MWVRTDSVQVVGLQVEVVQVHCYSLQVVLYRKQQHELSYSRRTTMSVDIVSRLYKTMSS